MLSNLLSNSKIICLVNVKLNHCQPWTLGARGLADLKHRESVCGGEGLMKPEAWVRTEECIQEGKSREKT